MPQLQKIPFLIHGFGTSALTESAMEKNPEWKDFALVSLRQVHSDSIHYLEVPPLERLSGDALITDRPHMLLSIRTADCLPVLFVSEEHKAIAAVHCGWRGTAKGLVQKVVETMGHKFGIRPSSLVVALGPSVEQGCYEVGDDVRNGFQDREIESRFFKPNFNRKGKYFFDLKEMNRFQLLSAGVEDKNIHSVNECTVCDKKYFSYRRDTDETGRMINFIGISSQPYYKKDSRIQGVKGSSVFFKIQ